MGEIVNLRRAKKQRTRAEENQTARENRIRHARTAAQKANDVRAEVLRQAVLDGKKNP